jgi:2-polyprenyl-6-methoxyphenol hydroxylase-like FAD-dependent oxidoreductase
MSLPHSTDVLIVGAGPAGLATAVSLLTHGITNITIVDAQAAGANVSRAIVIHARTVEDLASIGCADALTRRGLHAKSMSVRARTQLLVRANFAGLSPYTPYPFALLISQAETEDVLEQRLHALGGAVRRPFRVAGLEGTDTGVSVTFETGERMNARYVVGADGARSTVRRLAGIRFRDPVTKKDPHAAVARPRDSAKQENKKFGLPLIISDVHLAGPMPACINPAELSTFLGPLGFLLLMLLPAAADDLAQRPIYRLSCPQEHSTDEVTAAAGC